MPEINQYSVKPRELVELIIKAAGIHEGRWWLNINFGISPGNFGPSENEVVPGIAIAVQTVGVQREMPGVVAPPALVVDAAVVNPGPKKARR